MNPNEEWKDYKFSVSKFNVFMPLGFGVIYNHSDSNNIKWKVINDRLIQFYSIKDIPISFRFSILVARRVYKKIGHKILSKKNFENYQNSGKIYVSNIEKILETFLSIFDLIKLLLINKNDDYIQHDHFLISEELNLNERI